jgi:hypothetical protein
VSKAPLTVTALASAKNYDGGTTSSVTPSVSGLVAGDVASTPPVETYDSGNAGTTRVLTPSGLVLAGGAISNYTVTYVPISTGVINKVQLAFAADNASKTYGDVNPTFTGTVTGFVNSETQASATTGTLAFISAATTSSTPGTYAINGSGFNSY